MGVVLLMSGLPVAEVFGPVFQGEGPYMGQRTGFVRLGLCNLTCEWCDTAYTWDRTRYDVDAEAPVTSVEDVHARLESMDVEVVCLSGGEPLMHHQRLEPLVAKWWRWHCESNGTIVPPEWWADRVEHTSVSPKINTRDPYRKRIKPRALGAWLELARAGQACFKFVAAEIGDLELIQDVVDLIGAEPEHVWVMPLGTTATELVTRHQDLAEHIGKRGWNTTTRLHILLYGQERMR